MARAEASYERRVTGVDLHLSEAEAEVLYVILGNVGGDPNNSPRKHASDVRNALSGVVTPYMVKMLDGELPNDHPAMLREGSIHFADYGSNG